MGNWSIAINRTIIIIKRKQAKFRIRVYLKSQQLKVGEQKKKVKMLNMVENIKIKIKLELKIKLIFLREKI